MKIIFTTTGHTVTAVMTHETTKEHVYTKYLNGGEWRTKALVGWRPAHWRTQVVLESGYCRQLSAELIKAAYLEGIERADERQRFVGDEIRLWNCSDAKRNSAT